MRGLRDKIVIVTGAAGAMGRAICLRLAEEGCIVAGFDINALRAKAAANGWMAIMRR